MSDTLTAIRDGIEEIFPEADEMDITPDTLLGISRSGIPWQP